MRQVIEGAGLDKDRWPARQLAGLIDSWKNRGLTPAKVPRGEAFGFAEGKGAELYAAYQQRLKELNAADFGDLLLEVLRLLVDNADLLADYRRRFRYILVDEYQDTNVAQYLWLRLLTGGGCPIFAASVMTTSRSTAGAGPRSTTSCASSRISPVPRSFWLERNYRSNGHILAAASHLIAHNKARLGKTLFTDRDLGRPVSLCRGLGRRGGSARHRPGDRGAAEGRTAAEPDRHPGARLLSDACLRGSLCHAWLALSRHRRPALL